MGKRASMLAVAAVLATCGSASAQLCATNRDGREAFEPCRLFDPVPSVPATTGAASSNGVRRTPPDAQGFVDVVDDATGRVLYSVMPPGACVQRLADGRSVCAATPGETR